MAVSNSNADDRTKLLVCVKAPVNLEPAERVLEGLGHELARRQIVQVQIRAGDSEERRRGQVDIVVGTTSTAVDNGHFDLAAVSRVGYGRSERAMALFVTCAIEKTVTTKDGMAATGHEDLRLGEEVTSFAPRSTDGVPVRFGGCAGPVVVHVMGDGCGERPVGVCITTSHLALAIERHVAMVGLDEIRSARVVERLGE